MLIDFRSIAILGYTFDYQQNYLFLYIPSTYLFSIDTQKALRRELIYLLSYHPTFLLRDRKALEWWLCGLLPFSSITRQPWRKAFTIAYKTLAKKLFYLIFYS